MKSPCWLPFYSILVLAGLVVLATQLCPILRPPLETTLPVKDNTLKLGIGTWPGFCSAMVGKEKGFFEGINVEHKVLDGTPARHAAFQSGGIDIMISSLDVFVQEAASGIKGEIVLITDESSGGDGMVAKLDIKTAADLKGKKIAFARATPSHFLLYKVLQKNNLLPKDIIEVKVEDPTHAGQAFLGGSVDAAVTWEPLLTEVKEKGKGHILFTTRDYPGIVVDVLIASEKLIQNPDLLIHFIEGWLKSVDYIEQHPEESAQIIAKGLGIKNEDVQGMMMGLRFAGIKRNRDFFEGDTASETKIAAMLKDAGNFWVSQQIIESTPITDSLISPISINYFSQNRKGYYD